MRALFIAMAATLLAGAAAAQSEPCALVPANYAVHGPADDPGVSATWLAGGGVRLRAGDDATRSRAVRIWCRTAPPAGDVEFSFIVRRLDDNEPVDETHGIFALFVERFVGTKPGYAPDPTEWTAEQYGPSGKAAASDDVYRDAGQGYRSSFMNNSPDAKKAWMTRLRTYEGPGHTMVSPISPKPQPGGHWFFARDEDYRVSYERVGDRLTATQTRLSDGTRKVTVFESPIIGGGGLGVGGFMGWSADWGRHYELRQEAGVPLVRAR